MPSAAASDDARGKAGNQTPALTASPLAALAGLVADRSRPPAEAGREFLLLAADLTGMDGALLSRVEPSGGATVLAVAGTVGIAAGARLPHAEAFGGAAAAGGFPLALPDVESDPAWRDHPVRRRWPAVRACYGVPVIRPDGEPFGALACVAAEPRALDPDRCDVLTVLAAVVTPLALRLDAAVGGFPPPSAERDLARFRAMVEHASEALAEIDPAGRIRYANPAFAGLLGLARGDAGRGALLDLVHPDDAGRWAAALSAGAAVAAPPVALSGRLRRADETWRWVEATVARRSVDPGDAALVLTARDVAERVAADPVLMAERERARGERELRRERDLLRAVMDAIPDVLIVKDAEGRYLRVNRAAADLMQIADPDAAIGQLPGAFWPPPIAEAVAGDDAEVLGGHELSDVLARSARGDRWFLSNRLPLRDADGRIAGLVVASRDVTGLHRAGEEAAARQGVLARYKLLVDFTTDVITELDADGIVRSANPSVMRLLGQRPAAIVGTSGFDWIASEDRDAVREAFAAIVATPGVSPSIVARAVRADGSRAWLEFTPNNRLHDPAVGTIVCVIRDVSVQHEAEDRLRAKRDLLQAVIDASSEIIAAMDAEGRFTLMNAAAARAFGLPDVTVGVGKLPSDIFSPEEGARQEREARQTMGSGTATTNEVVYGEGGGAPAWFLMNRHPLRDAYGRVTGMVGVARDVTPLKLAEQAAATERDLLQAFIDVVPDMLFLKDADGRFLRMNAAYAHWLGLPNPAAAVGMTAGDFVPPDEAADLAEQDRWVVETGEPLRDYLSRSDDSGEARWFLRTKLPHRDASGRVAGIVGDYRDVTAIVLAEQELERERDLLQQILDALRDRILVKDRHGRYVRINRAAAQSLGLADPAEAVGRSAGTLPPASVVEAGLAGDAAALAGEVVENLREERMADGSSRWMLVGKTPLRGPEGDVVGLVIAATDVSVVKEAEQRMAEALRREQAINAELERLDQARSAFIAMLSHEFRTPLTAIMGYGEMLREYAVDPDAVREYAGEIARSADRLSRLTGDVLDLERMRTDRFRIERAPVDLVALLREVVTALKPSSLGHDLLLEVDADLPPVAGDADRLVQVFTNLVSNAVKYSPDGGAVVVAAHAEGNHLLASVRDEGLGIPPDELERVFEPYVRLDAGSSRGIRGTGLGLPIARQLIDLHGGTIWAESEAGGGSTFFVRLPIGAAVDGGR